MKKFALVHTFLNKEGEDNAVLPTRVVVFDNEADATNAMVENATKFAEEYECADKGTKTLEELAATSKIDYQIGDGFIEITDDAVYSNHPKAWGWNIVEIADELKTLEM